MCRFLAYWGTKPRKLTTFLLEAPNSLFQQSIRDDSQRPNADGWGISYYEGNRPLLIKQPNPAFKDPLFKQISQELESHLVFAHVRRRSHGGICYENTHPFIIENWMFMHHGTIPDFEQLRIHLARSACSQQEPTPTGTTDSEFLFHFLINQIHIRKIQETDDILRLQQEILDKVITLVPRQRRTQLALNYLMTNGKFVLGYRRNRTLHYTLLNEGILIASEILNPDYQWIVVPEDHFIFCQEPGKVRVLAHHLKDVESRKHGC